MADDHVSIDNHKQASICNEIKVTSKSFEGNEENVEISGVSTISD